MAKLDLNISINPELTYMFLEGDKDNGYCAHVVRDIELIKKTDTGFKMRINGGLSKHTDLSNPIKSVNEALEFLNKTTKENKDASKENDQAS